MKNHHDGKTALTPDEVLRVAVASILRNVDQAVIAELLGVNNPGRIAEAVVAMRWAMENHKKIYRHVQKHNGKRVEPHLEPLNAEEQTKLLKLYGVN